VLLLLFRPLLPIIRSFFIAAVSVCFAASCFAQDADTTTVENSRLYHILFDSTLASRTPVLIDTHADISRYLGGMTDIYLRGARRTFTLIDSNGALQFVDIRCNEEPQYVEIDRLADDTVEVSVYQRDQSTRAKKGSPDFHHVFDAAHTSEIRLHLGDDDDYAIVRGSVNSSILVRVIGDQGNDEMVDSSHVIGHVLHILPIKKDEKKTIFYGEPSETNFIYSPSTEVRSITPEQDSIYRSEFRRDWGHAWRYYPKLGYTSDDGVKIGAAVSLINYSFLDNPCRSIMTLRAMLATAHLRYKISYDEWFPQVLGGSFSVLAEASTLDRLSFFGYGNETKLNQSDFENDKYLVGEHLYQIMPKYSTGIFENTIFNASVALRYINTDSNAARDTTFLRRRHQYGVGSQLTTQLSYGIAFDSRDEARAATKGIYAGFESRWTPEILDNSYAYTSLHADIRAYLTASILTPVTLALRIDANKIFGEHPFYESAFMGGATSLRGFYRDRFAGEGSYLGTAELRIKLASLTAVVPSTLGLHLFADAGRVYVDNDFSNAWHTSIGGGLWFAPVSSAHTIVLTVAHSDEATQLYLTTGFAF
jgi:hypothetical protein